jgi:hypothetical protein
MKSLRHKKTLSSLEKLQRLSDLHRSSAKHSRISPEVSMGSEFLFKTADRIYRKSSVSDINKLVSVRSSPSMHTLVYGEETKVNLEIPRGPYQRKEKLWSEGNRRLRKDNRTPRANPLSRLSSPKASATHRISRSSNFSPGNLHTDHADNFLFSKTQTCPSSSAHNSPRAVIEKALKLEDKIANTKTTSIKYLKAHLKESTHKYEQLKYELRTACGADADEYLASRKARWKKEQFNNKHEFKEIEAKEMKKILEEWRQEKKRWVYI